VFPGQNFAGPLVVEALLPLADHDGLAHNVITDAV
jgi:hypothetical protein